MTFSPEQIEALKAPLDRSHVRERKQANRVLSYVEGWHAIAEANRIFGFDGWASETVDIRCVSEGPRKLGRPPQQRDGWAVTYIARVRITVHAEDRTIIREGVGSGHGIDADLGLAHESALKEAETDARKRGLMTFGNPFGLALYDKDQRNVVETPPAHEIGAAEEYVAKALTIVETLSSKAALETWWRNEAPRRRNLGLNQALVDEMRAAISARLAALAPAAQPVEAAA